MKNNNHCIPTDALKGKPGKGESFRLIDVRSREEYEQQHIPGAIHITLDQLEHSLKEFDQKIKYITICGKGGGRSARAAAILQSAGFQASWLCGGTLGWDFE